MEKRLQEKLNDLSNTHIQHIYAGTSRMPLVAEKQKGLTLLHAIRRMYRKKIRIHAIRDSTSQTETKNAQPKKRDEEK